MKRIGLFGLWFGFVVLVFCFAAVTGIKVITGERVQVVRGQVAEPAPSPTPVDQGWRVEYGDVDTLELKLKELNKLNIEVSDEQIHISDDGKRFVLIWAKQVECEDCN